MIFRSNDLVMLATSEQSLHIMSSCSFQIDGSLLPNGSFIIDPKKRKWTADFTNKPINDLVLNKKNNNLTNTSNTLEQTMVRTRHNSS
jgi:hypothetical protein